VNEGQQSQSPASQKTIVAWALEHIVGGHEEDLATDSGGRNIVGGGDRQRTQNKKTRREFG
jgi:hypothetical protein